MHNLPTNITIQDARNALTTLSNVQLYNVFGANSRPSFYRKIREYFPDRKPAQPILAYISQLENTPDPKLNMLEELYVDLLHRRKIEAKEADKRVSSGGFSFSKK